MSFLCRFLTYKLLPDTAIVVTVPFEFAFQAVAFPVDALMAAIPFRGWPPIVVKVPAVNRIKGFGEVLYKPEGATGTGVFLYAAQNIENTETEFEESGKKKKKNKVSTAGGPTFIERVWTGMKRFVFDID